jgi:hypothetical protein
MIPVRVDQEKNTRNAADSTKRHHCGLTRWFRSVHNGVDVFQWFTPSIICCQQCPPQPIDYTRRQRVFASKGIRIMALRYAYYQPSQPDMLTSPMHVGFVPIVLKKSEMPPQQNLRKSELIADFGWRCPLRVREKAAE